MGNLRQISGFLAGYTSDIKLQENMLFKEAVVSSAKKMLKKKKKSGGKC